MQIVKYNKTEEKYEMLGQRDKSNWIQKKIKIEEINLAKEERLKR